MQIENVTGISFTAWWTTQQQGYLTVCPCLFGQVIINDQGIFATIAEIFTHGATGIRSQVLHGGRIRSSGSHNDCVFQCAVLFELANNVIDSGCFLTNSHINASNVFAFLVDDGINSNSGFTSLTVTNNQLTLTTTNGYHGVNRLDTGLQWLGNRLTGNNAWRHFFDNIGFFGIDRAFAIDGLTQCIYNATTQFGTNGHFKNATGCFNRVTFGHTCIIT